MQTEKILTKLHDDEVAFIIVGGVAGLAHGLTRATFDVDICYWRHPDNVDLLCQSLAPLHPRLRDARINIPFQLDRNTVLARRDLLLDTDWGALDLLAEIEGLGDYESLLGASEEVDLFDKRLLVLTLDALIRAKQAVGRPQDVADVIALEAVRELRRRRDT